MPSEVHAARRSRKASKRVSKAYINELHEKLAAYRDKSSKSGSSAAKRAEIANVPCEGDVVPAEAQYPNMNFEDEPTHRPEPQNTETEAANAAPLTNPLAFHVTDWIPDPTGNPLFMGTSSSWAFGRRVLGMTHETLTGSPLFQDPNNLLFDNHVYDLKWDGNRANCPDEIFDITNLPTQDFALYLINSVRFHCGQLFYLFDETIFMDQFASFQSSSNPVDFAKASPLWFCHYLLILAFGKCFVVQSTRSKSPPGGEHFVQAMQCMPDFTFYKANPIEKIQVLCCAALYLQCTHSRSPAYRMIGTALRMALENGMYTGMHGIHLEHDYIQRCRLVWWTVYVLERRMSSLLGVPMGITEESISVSLPSNSRHFQNADALQMQVTLCQILAKVDLTVYGKEGKIDRRYISATQSVLRDIAKVTEQLNTSFDLYENGSMRGISRVSAHLHLLGHQCIVLTTRPLLYIFLQSKLGLSDAALLGWLESGTVKSLIHMCVESAQQSLRILSKLLEQGLLETFLPFDVDAVFTSTVPLLMAATISPSLLSDHSPWSQRAYVILDDMSSRGNLSARLIGSELKQLDVELSQILPKGSMEIGIPVSTLCELGEPVDTAPPVAPTGYSPSLEPHFTQGFGQNYELNSDQLLELANSLDINGLSFPLSSLSGYFSDNDN